MVLPDPVGPTIDNFLDKVVRLPPAAQRAAWGRIHYLNTAGLDGYVAPLSVFPRSGSLYERALEVLQDIDPPPPDAATVDVLRAEALIRLNRVQEGLGVLEKALSLYPSNVDLLRLRAELHVQDKQYENAITLLERALLIDRYDYACRNAFIDGLRLTKLFGGEERKAVVCAGI